MFRRGERRTLPGASARRPDVVLVAVRCDGKVYVSTESGALWVLEAGKKLEVLPWTKLPTAPFTLTAADGMLYLPTQQGLPAIPEKQTTSKTKP